jgi:predicted nucleic acid-binding protein
MLYWDTSALFAALVAEKHSAALIERVAAAGPQIAYTSMITPIELESALQRRVSDRTLNKKEADRARLLGVEFKRKTALVPLDHNAMDIALHLQKIYGLRPGDAIQLASARMGTDDPARIEFLSLDESLNQAARLEGFRV